MTWKWIIRIAAFTTAFGFLWLAMLLTDSPQLVIEERPADNRERNEKMVGEIIELRSFNEDGQPELSVRARRGTQNADQTWKLLENEVEMVTASGRVVHFFADELKDDAGVRTISSQPGSRILISEKEGLEMETPGPITVPEDLSLNTQARTEFRFGPSSGSCRGLHYVPGLQLDMLKDARFRLVQGPRSLQLDGASLRLNLQKATGVLKKGMVDAFFGSQHEATFQSEEMEFSFSPGTEPSRWGIQEISAKGNPGRFRWGTGELLTESFLVCFSDTAQQQLDQVLASGPSRFAVETEEGYTLDGRTGGIQVWFAAGEPERMASTEPVTMQGLYGRQVFSLGGSLGFESSMEQGRLASTTVFGAPTFSFGAQHGRAGSLRLLHDEARILLGEGAWLEDPAQALRVSGEEILLADWGRQERNVFARNFVEFQHAGMGVEGKGDQLSMTMPGRILELRGQPAVLTHEGNVVTANWVEVRPGEDQEFFLKAAERIEFEFLLDGDLCSVIAKSMELDSRQGLLDLRDVERASVPSVGQLGARILEMTWSTQGGTRYLTGVHAEDQVVFEGHWGQAGEQESVSCQADVLDYDPEQELLSLEGRDRDVVVHMSNGQVHRLRQLTFNLGDGSMQADSERGFTKTILNIERKPEKMDE